MSSENKDTLMDYLWSIKVIHTFTRRQVLASILYSNVTPEILVGSSCIAAILLASDVIIFSVLGTGNITHFPPVSFNMLKVNFPK